MIPSIPNKNKLGANSGYEENLPNGLLDEFPLTGGSGSPGIIPSFADDNRGFAASTFCLKKSAYKRKLIKVRRGSDNTEVDVFPHKINEKLYGLHPDSKTSLGNTITEFANGGETFCVRMYDQIATGEPAANDDLYTGSTGAQPNVTDSSGNLHALGNGYGIDFDANNSSEMRILHPGEKAEFPQTMLSWQKKTGSSGATILGQFMGWFHGDQGNFGAKVTTMNYGANLSHTSNDLDGENIVAYLYAYPNTSDGQIFQLGDGTSSDNVITSSSKGSPGTNTPSSGGGSYAQYGKFYVGSGYPGVLPGIVFFPGSRIDTVEDIINFWSDITGIS